MLSVKNLPLQQYWIHHVEILGYLQNLDPDSEKPGPRKTWTRKNLDLEKPGTWKTWTQKNLDSRKLGPKKHEINIGLKCMSDFRELCFIKTMRNVNYCLKVHVLTDI